MPSSCAVRNCSDRYGHAENISFHKFPFKRQELLQKWLDFTQRGTAWKPSRWSAICSRHFREEDFNRVNERKTLKKTAVPSVRIAEQLQSIEVSDQREQQTITNSEEHSVNAVEQIHCKADEHEAKESQNTAEEHEHEHEETQIHAAQQGSPSVPKFNCRLCGHDSSNVVTFSTNFEIYGMIQKCFPTLNIQKDDNLPKEMCRVCLKRLESFSRFIDKVLETQSELECKFRTEKTNSSLRAVERQLKVKQEPVVRVKQEVAEGLDSFLSDDLDIGMDDGCDQDADSGTVEQKFDFCDFPMLNAQDIINNCDIMEIINLDDPFINIPDDDANTNCDTQQQQLPPKRTLQSAHELLQAHLLIEEHSYAYAAEDMKEEWQLKSFYKTEKIEGAETNALTEDLARVAEHGDDDVAYGSDDHAVSMDPLNEAEDATASNNPDIANELSAVEKFAENRSTKPIVTSVSELAETRLPLPVATEGSGNADKLIVTAVNTLPASNTAPGATKAHAKPNIVVLNESIVKSSSAFQLYTCSCCHLKFFSIESLNQHYATLHQQLPMVSVPGEYAWKPNCGNSETCENNCKTEKENDMNRFGVEMNASLHNSSVCQTNLYKLHATSVNVPPVYQELHKNLDYNATVNNKNQVKILEMQQSFLRQHEHYTTIDSTVLNNAKTAVEESTNWTVDRPRKVNIESTKITTVFRDHRNVEQKHPAVDAELKLSAPSEARSAKYVVAKRKAPPSSGYKTTRNHQVDTSKKIAENFLQLRRRYRQLQRKCKNLEAHIQVQQHTSTASWQQQQHQPLHQRQHIYPTAQKVLPFRCRICRLSFANIYRLLRHKQTRRHWTLQPPPRFAATCCGCEKFFRSKVSLRNHMRYICQSLPLRWLKTQMQIFKCRCCRRSTFNHWRLYRRHEVRCKRRQELRKKARAAAASKVQHSKKSNNGGQHHMRQAPIGAKKCPKAATNNARRSQNNIGVREYACALCKKVYPSGNSLNQHSITHSDQRKHKCVLCARVFKRRNGLTQHVKGYHLQLKPYQCPVCQHCYALKSDMLRCRHSVRRGCAAPAAAHATAPTLMPMQSQPIENG